MKPCKTCPFVKAHPLRGAPQWLLDVIKLHEVPGFLHTCHKTDPTADGYFPGRKGRRGVRECSGWATMEMNRLDKTPGKGGVWESLKNLVFAYHDHWKAELDRREEKNAGDERSAR